LLLLASRTNFLKDNGWFGFLVSSSWLDVEYGFALQSVGSRQFPRFTRFGKQRRTVVRRRPREDMCGDFTEMCQSIERNAQLSNSFAWTAIKNNSWVERLSKMPPETLAEEFCDEMHACKKTGRPVRVARVC